MPLNRHPAAPTPTAAIYPPPLLTPRLSTLLTVPLLPSPPPLPLNLPFPLSSPLPPFCTPPTHTRTTTPTHVTRTPDHAPTDSRTLARACMHTRRQALPEPTIHSFNTLHSTRSTQPLTLTLPPSHLARSMDAVDRGRIWSSYICRPRPHSLSRRGRLRKTFAFWRRW